MFGDSICIGWSRNSRRWPLNPSALVFTTCDLLHAGNGESQLSSFIRKDERSCMTLMHNWGLPWLSDEPSKLVPFGLILGSNKIIHLLVDD